MEQIAPPVLVVGWAPDGALRILDQRRLPAEVLWRDLRTVEEVADAIRTVAVRGAPAICDAGALATAGIGTYGLAVLAKYHGIPFVVAAPTSTIDPHTADGSAIVTDRGIFAPPYLLAPNSALLPPPA